MNNEQLAISKKANHYQCLVYRVGISLKNSHYYWSLPQILRQ